MMWETSGGKSEFLSADERILLALYLINQEKSISWLTGWLAPAYDGKNVYATLSRLANRQLADRIAGIEGRRVGKYRITRLGIAWLERRFPLVVRQGSDPSRLAAVAIDAAEVKGRRRKLIFDELKKWRYGRLSRGIYVTGSQAAQAAVAEFVSQYRLGGYVNLMTIYPAENPKAVADRVFRLGERNAKWRLLVDRINEWRKIGDSPARRGAAQTGWRRIRNDFLEMLVTEPGLPPELKPENYFMNSAIRIMVSV